MRVIIACAGGQGKWGNHLGVPSHLVPVHGQPLLHRTVGQALALTGDVHVTAPDDDRYQVPGATLHVRTTQHPSEYQSTRDLWSDDGRTVLLYGDTYFTDRAIGKIAGYAEHRFRAFARAGRSKVTGCRWGEFFAASWWPEHHRMLDDHLAVAMRARQAGNNRPVCWVLLRSIQGSDLGKHWCDPGWFTSIDDETEDFDTPLDYHRHPVVRRQVVRR